MVGEQASMMGAPTALIDTFQKSTVGIRDEKVTDGTPKYITSQFWVDVGALRAPISQLVG